MNWQAETELERRLSEMAIEVVALTEENRVLEVEIEGGIKMDREILFRGKQKTEDGYMEI